ncbi:MAG: hypothetical protein HKN71_00005 [Gemmatimonadetes bacterium]|nr:hypothetical protein [Gemmatimonadota bacterium]
MALSVTGRTAADSRVDSTLTEDPELVRHVKRPQWGLAILAWERDEKRGYQFEDGRLRVFSSAYANLMEPAEPKNRPEDAVIADLQAALGTPGEDREPLQADATFEQQVALFESLYPEGFQGEAWAREMRAPKSGGRALKRHRDPSIAVAQSVFDAGEVAAHLAEGRHSSWVDSVLDVLAETTLVSRSRVKALREMGEDERRTFAEAVADLVHGEDRFAARFKTWVRVLREGLDGKASWRLATSLPALVDPESHICVRHSAFIRQAAVIAPTSAYSRRPTARAYRNFRRVAEVVRTRLEAAGHEPRDLMDVLDFIWTTMRASSVQHL